MKPSYLSALLVSCLLCFANASATAGGHSHKDHDHGHDHTPHHGIVKPFLSSENKQGYVELKLHDDKGDLELWLTKDGKDQVFDLPVDSVITVSFPELNNKTVELRVRDTDKNEDEDGKGNIRNQKTNYFIFPGDTGVSAEFLVGKDFAADVVVEFSMDNEVYKTETFLLKPHTH